MSDDINNRLVNYLVHKPKDQVIDKFEDYFSFLNNDEPSWVLYEAFQGARAPNFETKERIANVDSPDELIEIASAIEDPADWDVKRLKVMEILIRDKFRRSLEMRERLRLTEEKQIVCRFYEESPSNLFWGIVGNKGQNQVGRILEKVRADINENSDLKKWLLIKFPLQNDKILLPSITLNVSKDGELLETISLKGRSYYYMGQYKTNSVLLAHPSISRLHACIICEEGNKVRLIDMESKSGSFVNGEILEKLADRELQNGDILTFALSTRSYEIKIDYTEVQKELQKRNAQLQQQVKQLQRLNQPSITPEELRRIMGFSIDDTLFVSGLPDNATVLGVRQLFSEYAKVKDVKIPVDKWNGKQRGFAYVMFENQQEFSKAFLHSMNLKYGETKVKVKIADKDKSSQLMNICRIDDESDRRKRGHDNQGRRDRNERTFDKSRDNRYKRKSSKSRSRSRSNERRDRDRDRDRNRSNKFDRESGKEEKNNRFSKQDKTESNDKPESKEEKQENVQVDKDQEKEKEREKEKDKPKSKENKDERKKRSSSRDNNKKKESRRERSDSRSKKSKTTTNDKEKRKSTSPKSKTQSKTESKKQSSRKSKSRSREREREKDRNRDRERERDSRRDNRDSKKDSRSKRSSSRDRKDRRKSKSRDRKSKSKERQDKKQSNKSEQQYKSDKYNEKEQKSDKVEKVEKIEKSSADKPLREISKQSSNDKDRQNPKQSGKEQNKDNQNRSRKKSQSSRSSSSNSSGSSSSSRSNSSSNSNSRSSSSFSSSSSQSSQ